jgi:TonB family protein
VRLPSQLIIVLLLASTALPVANAAPPAKSPPKATAAGKKAAPASGAAQKAPAAGCANTGGSSAVLNSYATQLRQKMGNNWNYPDGKNHVTLTVDVVQDGSVSNLTLASTPKNNEAEQKANDAFNSAQPLQPLPAGNAEARITIVFDSQADQWNSKANIAIKIDTKKAEAPAAGTSPDNSKKEEEPKSEKKEDPEEKK